MTLPLPFFLSLALAVVCGGCSLIPKEEWRPGYHAPLPATNNFSVLMPPSENLAASDSRIQRLSAKRTAQSLTLPAPRPPVPLFVRWQNNNSNTINEVWQTADLSQPFTLVGTTNGESWPAGNLTVQPMAFFKVRARDTNTGALSAWATTNFISKPS